VGDYIANAVLAFAYNQDVVVIDTNIRRIILHEFASQAKRLKGEKANLEFDENLELSIEN
jgi:adenine-specific DNA glycosylase